MSARFRPTRYPFYDGFGGFGDDGGDSFDNSGDVSGVDVQGDAPGSDAIVQPPQDILGPDVSIPSQAGALPSDFNNNAPDLQIDPSTGAPDLFSSIGSGLMQALTGKAPVGSTGGGGGGGGGLPNITIKLPQPASAANPTGAPVPLNVSPLLALGLAGGGILILALTMSGSRHSSGRGRR